jgi:membrane protease YdiL (CAAX protease family)
VLLTFRLAHFEAIGPVSWSSLTFVTILLLFGAVGEELMFRGYGFQLLATKIGKFATLLPTAVLFGIVHMSNVGATPLAVVNTIGWGLLLGYAALKSRGLWLPIGIHYGWNWILPLLGANLSGFKMGVTGLRLDAAANNWAGGAYGPEASLVLTLLLPGLFYLIHRLPVPRQHALLMRGLED